MVKIKEKSKLKILPDGELIVVYSEEHGRVYIDFDEPGIVVEGNNLSSSVHQELMDLPTLCSESYHHLRF